MTASVSYDEFLIESLKNQDLAKSYLNAALEDDDPRVFLLALRNVAQAQGFSELAAGSKLNRSSRGNPSLRSLGALLDTLGLRLKVDSKDTA
jgi:probable addiction module antidote protein